MKIDRTHKPYLKLKGFLVEKDIKQYEVAKLLGKTKSTFNQNLNGTGSDFTLNDVRIICSSYNISADEYFFNQKVSKTI
ncbi:transcriptional regulator with XRE-family HTH domain [Sedimentibacter acidaminivorans]|uniref:Transcriptional regulator with XRE-family HTH domain n=1 Tax=Sedimentibacter acidaminivorans TaxID=913099 RepID=A0ABS4GDU3_9FIRM|nr:helix-turn-helix transcriptional regulator [Sedimentibacter acidaminivorans]MBP1925865.1 transcriptional regulator with XRE-family HTH domain [Sedimentibacter acidaminivorans]